MRGFGDLGGVLGLIDCGGVFFFLMAGILFCRAGGRLSRLCDCAGILVEATRWRTRVACEC